MRLYVPVQDAVRQDSMAAVAVGAVLPQREDMALEYAVARDE